jgi:DNA polymerase-3 subunit delta
LTKVLGKTAWCLKARNYENQVGDWIKRILASKNTRLSPKLLLCLWSSWVNLSKINNELEKLQIILPIGSLITLKILKKILDSVKTLMSLNCGKQ